jgi:hypothetical protein
MPNISTTPTVTKISPDGKEKTSEDSESVTTVKSIKKVEKPKETESTITVDEDESDD